MKHRIEKVDVESKLLEKINSWWNVNASSLLLPPMYDSHRHVWESLDMCCSVCRVCGVVHLCSAKKNVVQCVQIKEGHETICGITGVVISATNFVHGDISIQEYLQRGSVQDVCTINSSHDIRAMLLLKIKETIKFLLYSKEAHAAYEIEVKRYNTKVQSCIHGLLVEQNQPNNIPSVVKCVETCMGKIRNIRIPERKNIPPLKHWDRLIESIALLMNTVPLAGSPLLRSVCSDNHKMQNTIVGLLYIAPHGICVDGKVFLVAEPYLKTILPLQIILNRIFKLHPRVITETENTVKMLLKTDYCNKFDAFALERTSKPPSCPLSMSCGECNC